MQFDLFLKFTCQFFALLTKRLEGEGLVLEGVQEMLVLLPENIELLLGMRDGADITLKLIDFL